MGGMNVQLTCWIALLAMSLKGDMIVQMIEGAVRLIATPPATFVWTLDLVVASAGALLDGVAREGDERICL
jgi:hypothetical protein